MEPIQFTIRELLRIVTHVSVGFACLITSWRLSHSDGRNVYAELLLFPILLILGPPFIAAGVADLLRQKHLSFMVGFGLFLVLLTLAIMAP